jgi:antitoxin component of MazEF toxin-antitoxin module
MTTLKITLIGNSLGLILSREILARVKLDKGDAVCVAETPDGLARTPYGPDVAEQLSLGGDFLRECRDTFRERAN